jgi:hypothetical protein
MELRYNGSEGGGYIEDRFENGVPVTGTVEDWCERALEDNFRGWENSEEGCQGFFLFNMRNNTAELHHTYNERNNITTTLFEEEFGK